MKPYKQGQTLTLLRGDARIMNVLADVCRVFEHGEEKHGDDWKRTLSEEHLVHARSHLRHGNEEESGLPHLAHAAARCILALAAQSEEGR